jgi:hypothetical protein
MVFTAAKSKAVEFPSMNQKRLTRGLFVEIHALQ